MKWLLRPSPDLLPQASPGPGEGSSLQHSHLWMKSINSANDIRCCSRKWEAGKELEVAPGFHLMSQLSIITGNAFYVKLKSRVGMLVYRVWGKQLCQLSGFNHEVVNLRCLPVGHVPYSISKHLYAGLYSKVKTASECLRLDTTFKSR